MQAGGNVKMAVFRALPKSAKVAARTGWPDMGFGDCAVVLGSKVHSSNQSGGNGSRNIVFFEKKPLASGNVPAHS